MFVGWARGAGPTGEPDEWLPTAPDSALTRAALEAAADQGPDVEGHGLRTWLFGAMLARRLRVEVDPELLHVASIAHDAGLAQVVPGEDFTLRSAEIAVEAFRAAGRPLDEVTARMLRDGVVGHFTPGIDPVDAPLATAVQVGALADLVGLRLTDLPRVVVEEVYRRHPQRGVRRAIVTAIAAESAAVPTGRVATLRRLGFSQAVRMAPHRHL